MNVTQSSSCFNKTAAKIGQTIALCLIFVVSLSAGNIFIGIIVYKTLQNYMLAMLLVFIYSPLVLIAILYIIIYVILKAQTNPGEQTTNARLRRLKKERNVQKSNKT